MKENGPCVSCGQNLWSTLLPSNGRWGVGQCGACGLRRLEETETRATAGDEYEKVDLSSYRAALSAFRNKSSLRLLAELEILTPGRRLLDVGCGFAWFLETSRKRGWKAAGMDPSPRAVADGAGKGLDIRLGTFPEACPTDETYDIIAFMDVLEHLPNPGDVLQEVSRRLRPGGFVAIKLPNQGGPLYRLALGMARLVRGRFRSPVERLYQLQFPYPHLYYYGVLSLTTLLRRNGFNVARMYEEEILESEGVFQRLSYTETSFWRKALFLPQALLLSVLGPLLRRASRKDILTVVAYPQIRPGPKASRRPPDSDFVSIPPPVLRKISGDNARIPSLYYHPNFFLRTYFWARLRFLHELIKRHGAGKETCLDFGGGSGVLLPTLASNFETVTSVDLFIEEALQIKTIFGLSNVHLMQGDLLDVRLPAAPFDCVVAADVLEHFEDLAKPVARLREWVKNDGILLTSLPTESWMYRFLRRVFRIKKPVDHYHTGGEVERVLSENGFLRVETLHAPFRTVLASLFLVTVWRKQK